MRLRHIFIFFVPVVLWGIDVRTNIKEVNHEGCSEQIGSFSLVVRDNAFPGASYEHPVYIRFRIIQAHGWSRTLVDMRPGSDPANQDAIDLALRNNGSADIAANLPRDAVQLVRLIKGEREGWLKVNVSTSEWLFEEGAYLGPNTQNSTACTLGVTGQNSITSQASTPSHGNEYHSSGLIASTIMCANYENTPEFKAGDLDMLDFISFDSNTTGVETADLITAGSNMGVTFSDDTDIARGAYYIACFRMASNPDQNDDQLHHMGYSTLSMISLTYGSELIPPVYIQNCGDYEWYPGSKFYFSLLSHKLVDETFVEVNSCLAETMFFNGESVDITPFSNEKWQCDTLFDGDRIAGYRLTLLEGVFPSNAYLKVGNLSLALKNDSDDGPLDVYNYADLTNPVATGGDLIRYGSFISHLAELKHETPQLYHRVLPYTGYDEPSWEFKLRNVNPNETPSRITSFLSNRHGLLLRIDGNREIPAKGIYEFSIAERFGEEADTILAWVNQYSDQPFFSTGILHDPDSESFELIASRERSYAKLIAPHITSQDDWSTTAYILASGDDSPRFIFSSPGSESQHITAIRYPGATAVYTDEDFIQGSSKLTWFQVNAESSSANGQIFYYKENKNGELTSLPLGTPPDTHWSFDHLGKSENGWWNGLVVNNPGEISSLCTLNLLDAHGELLQTTSLEIEPESRRALLLQDLFEYRDHENQSVLALESDQPVLAFLLMGMEGKDQLSDVPGNLKSGQKLLLPYMDFSGDSWTGIVIRNMSTHAAGFYFEAFSHQGAMRQSTWIDLPVNSKIVFLPDEYLKDLQNYDFLIIYATRDVRGFALMGNQSQTELASLPLTPIP